MRNIELTVPQGIGDVFWVYQVFSPHVESITFNVLQVGTPHPRQSRVDFLQTLPKVVRVRYTQTTPEDYHDLASRLYNPCAVLAAGGGRFSLNAALESGQRIEDAAGGLTIAEQVPLWCEQPRDLPERYLLVYVSGDTANEPARQSAGIWPIVSWLVFLEGLHERFFDDDTSIVVIGASYDMPAMSWLSYGLHQVAPVKIVVDAPPAQVCWMIQHAAFFVGYQSGLNVIADQLNVSQLMMYFPHLKRMTHTWPIRNNIETGRYIPRLFSMSEQQVLNSLPRHLSTTPITSGKERPSASVI